jgi:hypothetical protein
MTTLKRGTIKAYSAATHKATVQIAGSLSVWLNDLPVAVDIAPPLVVAGRECAVLLFTDDNPDDGVVIALHGAAPPGVGAGSRIQDADNDTWVDVENAPDEDKVHAVVAAAERLLLQGSSPHVTLGGSLGGGGVTQVNDRLAVGGAIGAQDVETVNISTLINILRLAGSRTLTANIGGNLNFLAVGPTLDLAGFNQSAAILGLAFAGIFNDTVGGGAIAGINVLNLGGSTNAPVTTVRRINIPTPSGAVAPGTAVGLEMADVSALGSATAFGFRLTNLATGPVARALELGPTPYLRLLMSGEWTPAAEQTPLYLAEGAAPTLRNVQWVDPGAGGANFAGGERVMVLV